MSNERYADSRFDAELSAWLDERAGGPDADQVIDRALARTARTRQLPRWMVMEIPMRPVAFPRAGLIVFATLLLLVVVLAATVVLIGRPAPLPAPFGPAGAGLLAFDAGGDIFVANADGTGRRPLAATAGREFGPAWSPDGQRLAFWSVPANDPARIVVVDADGGNRIEIGAQERLIPDERKWPPVWSPDGSQLLVPTGQGHLFLAPAGGGDLRRLGSENAQLFYPAWSPDGDEIAYIDGGPHGGYISVMNVERGTETQVSTATGGAPTWSPDGQRLAYWTPVEPGDIFVATREGSDWTSTPLVEGATDDVGPSWSHDGTRLAFVRLNGAGGQVLVVPIAGGEPSVIADETSGAMFARICWSPDDRFVTVPSTRARNGGTGLGYVLIPADGSSSRTRIAATGIDSLDSCTWQRLAK